MRMPESILAGCAIREGTRRLADRLPQKAYRAFYRDGQDLPIASDCERWHRHLSRRHGRRDGRWYAEAVREALQRGVNVIDTSLNCRHQRSERAVAAGIRAFVQRDEGSREEILVCTKGGYLVPGAVAENTLRPDDVVGGMHSMAPAFLADQMDRRRSTAEAPAIVSSNPRPRSWP
jgi:hypothetical protein